MTDHSSIRIYWIFLLNLVVGAAFAGGRYADPPQNLVEVQQLSQKALEAAKQGDKDGALTAANQARKLAVASYKEKSTMPMQNSSSRLKSVVNALEGGAGPAEQVPVLEEVVKLMSDEVDYYKKEGKL